ncbi:MAG: hypothetical protein ACPGU1_17425 [Myxococcota bacterium]
MNDSPQLVPIMEGGLDEVTQAATHIDAEGIPHDVSLTGGGTS